MGLNAQAGKDVDALFSSGNQAASSLTVSGIVFLAFAAIVIAGTMQTWYERVYDQEPPHNWKRQLVNRVSWVVGLLAYIFVQVFVGQHQGPTGHHVLPYLVSLVVATLFWWWSIHALLFGRIGWRALFPTGLATGIGMTGLSVFSRLLFSGSVISDAKSYGEVGVLMALLSFAIGWGVVVHLGAVVGRMWNEREKPIGDMT